MTAFVFVVTIYLTASSHTITATAPAVIHSGQRPIQRIETCRAEADAMQERIGAAIRRDGGMFERVTVECRETRE